MHKKQGAVLPRFRESPTRSQKKPFINLMARAKTRARNDEDRGGGGKSEETEWIGWRGGDAGNACGRT